MKSTESFLEAARRFATETCRTPQSRTSTLSTLRQLAMKHPSLKLGQFTAVQLTNFVLANEPAPNTVKARRARIMAFFAWATWQKLIDKNPASELKFTAKAGKGGGVRQHTWLSIAEYKALLDAQPPTLEGRRARIVLMLGGMLGLRRSEIAALRFADFSDNLETVALTGKGGKVASLGVPDELRKVLGQWEFNRSMPTTLHMHMGASETILPAIVSREPEHPSGPMDYVFVYDWTQPIGASTVAGIVTEAGKQADIHLECHDLRRTFAGMLEESGFGIEDISRMLRHSNIGTTSVYVESNPRRTAALAKKFTINI